MYLPRISKEESDQTIKRALELGINYFDTAPGYGKSEGLMRNQRFGLFMKHPAPLWWTGMVPSG